MGGARSSCGRSRGKQLLVPLGTLVAVIIANNPYYATNIHITMEEATPRVNFETMQRYQNQRVMLCCQVLSVGNGQVKVQTSDKGEITVNGVNRPYESKFVEVTGRVTSPNTIDEESHLDLSENFSEYA